MICDLQRINFFSENEDVKKWLIQAGYPYELTVERFQGLKIFLMIIGFFAGGFSLILLLPFSQFMIILLPIFGYMSTILWIRSKAKNRQEEISYSYLTFWINECYFAGRSCVDQAIRDIFRILKDP
jgi:tight adherence protein C